MTLNSTECAYLFSYFGRSNYSNFHLNILIIFYNSYKIHEYSCLIFGVKIKSSLFHLQSVILNQGDFIP